MSLEEAICVLQTNPVILLQVVMVSPGTHLVKNQSHESQSRTNESLGLLLEQPQKSHEQDILQKTTSD